MLLDAGADPNIQDKTGRNSLMQLFNSRRSMEILKMLLDAGADPNMQDKKGNTTIVDDFSSFYLNVRSDYLKLLLEAGADPNIQNNEGNTPLIAHILCGKSVQMLLDAGADPNIHNNEGKTPLMIALGCRSGRNLNVIRMLVGSGALKPIYMFALKLISNSANYRLNDTDIDVVNLVLSFMNKEMLFKMKCGPNPKIRQLVAKHKSLNW